jgi:hypothetical protein
MAMFYFHIQTGDLLVKDEEGSELAGLDEAREEALEASRGILAEAIKSGDDWRDKAFMIADEQGRHLVSMPMTDALPKGLRRC